MGTSMKSYKSQTIKYYISINKNTGVIYLESETSGAIIDIYPGISLSYDLKFEPRLPEELTDALITKDTKGEFEKFIYRDKKLKDYLYAKICETVQRLVDGVEDEVKRNKKFVTLSVYYMLTLIEDRIILDYYVTPAYNSNNSYVNLYQVGFELGENDINILLINDGDICDKDI